MSDHKHNTIIYIHYSNAAPVNGELIAATTAILTKQSKYCILPDVGRYAPNGASLLLIIDGASTDTALQAAENAGLKPDFHLIVSELGLEHVNGAPVRDEDINLLIDAVEACCTMPDLSPKFHCPCCG